MSNLTASQVAAQLGVTSYTVKRWYAWYESLAEERLQELINSGMPKLPAYLKVGSRGDRIWKEEDIEALKAFRAWVPHTINGIFKK